MRNPGKIVELIFRMVRYIIYRLLTLEVIIAELLLSAKEGKYLESITNTPHRIFCWNKN